MNHGCCKMSSMVGRCPGSVRSIDWSRLKHVSDTCTPGTGAHSPRRTRCRSTARRATTNNNADVNHQIGSKNIMNVHGHEWTPGIPVWARACSREGLAMATACHLVNNV
jgi:hypothetical protein